MKPVLLGYFVRRVISATLLIWLAVWALLVFLALLRSADDGDFSTALLLAVLGSPQQALETLPFAAALGSTIAMRRMVGNGEMPALRTAGLPPRLIALFLFIAAVPFFAAYVFLSEVVLPNSADLSRIIQNKSSSAHGVWLADGGNYIRIGRIGSGGAMVSVVIYHTSGDELTGITRAARADYHGGHWVLHGARRLDSAGGALREPPAERAQEWRLPLRPASFTSFTRHPREMALADAMRAARELTAAGQRDQTLQRSIWRRWLTLPAIFLLTMLGINFIGGSRQQQYAVSLPVLLSALAAGGYFVLRDIAIQSAAISELWPMLLLPPLAFAGGVAYSVRRAATV